MRLERIASVGFGLVVLSGCGASPLVQGQRAFLKSDYDVANQKFDVASQKLKPKHPDYNIVKLNLALALWERQDYAAAKATFEDVAYQIWGERGWGADIKETTGGLKNASKREWLGEENEQIYIRIYIGIAYMIEHQYDEAIVEFQRCIEKNPNYPIVEYLWGLAAREVEDENATVHFEQARTLLGDKPNPAVDVNRAYLKRFYGDEDAARMILASVPVQMDAEDPSAQASNMVLLLEKNPGSRWGNTKKNPSTLRILIDGVDHGPAYFIDNTANRESFKSALGQAVAGAAGQALRNELANRIPFVGLFMGGNRKAEVARWLLLADSFYTLEARLAPGTHTVTIQAVTLDGSKVLKTVERTVEVRGSDLVVVPAIL